ncbi:MAG: hypothetical protein RMN53_17190, partial [Anaerolineae bacterium]|nr:hypothetical protein [Anaerolineae bacterium]
IVQKRGAFYTFGDIRLGQGRENAKEFLQKSPDLFWQIDGLIRDQAGLPRTFVPQGEPAKVVAMPSAPVRPPRNLSKRATDITPEEEAEAYADEPPEDFDLAA